MVPLGALRCQEGEQEPDDAIGREEGKSRLLGKEDVNQRQALKDATWDNTPWEYLGTFQIIGNSLVGGLWAKANGYTVADAVRIERTSPLGMVSRKQAIITPRFVPVLSWMNPRKTV